MHKCQHCGEITKQGYYDYTGKFTCQKCLPLVHQYHFDIFTIEQGAVKKTVPAIGMDNSAQRAYTIDFAYRIFNNKLNPAAYRLLSYYVDKKGYTYLGIVRALEYFYIIKKNSIAKSKNNIGIIPYIYTEAQTYYQNYNNFLHRKYLKTLTASHQEAADERIVEVDESNTQPIRNKIDMDSL